MAGASFGKSLDKVGEVLDVSALIRRDRNTLDILLERCCHDLFNTAVVPEVHDLDTLGLQEPAHNVDGGIVPIKDARGRNKPNRVLRDV